MNLFNNRQQVQPSPRTTSDAKDIEALLPKHLDTPPKPTDPLPESPQQICGLPVQLVSGAAYCTGISMILQRVQCIQEAWPVHPAVPCAVPAPCYI